MATEDAEPWSPDERWAMAYVHHRLPTLPKCGECGRLLFTAKCWHCEEARQRAADERAHELARKLRSWRKHEVEWSQRAKARREARKAAAV